MITCGYFYIIDGMEKAYINEIYSSVQGEGLYAGQRCIFVRFALCNLRCWYCDTKYAWDSKRSRLLSVEDVIREIKNLGNSNFICITGGEPLLQAEFISKLLSQLKEYKIFLETNGTLPEAYFAISKYLHATALCVKQSVDCGRDFWNEYERILKLSSRIFVKLLISPKTTTTHIKNVIDLVKKKDVPLMFQPITIDGRIYQPTLEQISEWVELAKDNLSNVYFIPQMHKLWNLK